MNTPSSLPTAQPPLTGTHLLGGVFTGQAVHPTMQEIQAVVPTLIAGARLTELGSVYHSFETGGYTAIVALAESHLSIHTWPEIGYVTIDVFICNVYRDNADICEQLFSEIVSLFKPVRVERTKILR